MNYSSKLQEVIDEIDILIEKRVTASDPEFKAWKNKAERVLIKIYGEDSYELKELKKTQYSLTAYVLGTPREEFADKCARSLQATKRIFEEYLREQDGELGNALTTDKELYDKVFIVHGHDGELKAEVQILLQKQKIEGIILSEQANGGKTIIEKFEEYSSVGAAIVLMTADDEGRKKGAADSKFRARQNVIFEAGYFMGKLGRDKVILIADPNIEIPSDLQGVVYSDRSNWRMEVLAELKKIGYEVDANLLL